MATSLPQSEVKQPFSTGSSFDLEPNPFEQSFAHKDEKQGPSTGNTSSPPILTPGGRKLPPLVLSPNVPSSWGTTQFPRTGLTPNESSLRTGLTPGGAAFPHSLNNIGLSGLNTPGGSLGFTGFTPGLSSLLGTNTKEFDQQAQANTAGVVAGVTDVRNGNIIPTSQQQLPHPPPPELSQLPIQQQQQQNSHSNDRQKETTTIETSSQPKKSKRKGSNSRKSEEESDKRAAKKLKEESVKEPQEVDDAAEEDELNTENMTEEEKRRSFLERNRVAASKCRQRKKQQIQKMETDLNFYLNEYNNLTATVDSLKEQSLILRNLVSNKSINPDIVTSVENILMIINQTNYMSRLRGDNPSNIIPTVQPVNPTLVQQSQQRAAVAAISTIPAVPPQVVQNSQPQPMMIHQQQQAQLSQQPQQHQQMSAAQNIQLPINVGNGMANGNGIGKW